MDATILTAIVGGVFTIVASILTLVITRIVDSNSFPTTRKVRQISLTGHWEGTLHQEVGPNGTPMDSRMTITLKSTHRGVRGESIRYVTWQNRDIAQHLFLAGKFVYDRFLRMEYEVTNMPGSVQFGYLLVELSPDGQILDGRFLGFGATSRNIVWGTMQFHKQGSISHTTAPSQTTI